MSPYNSLSSRQLMLLVASLLATASAGPLSVSFTSLNEKIAGDLYLPQGKGPFPAVVTGPGFAGVKEMLIPDYANALANAGVATLAFDYVGFGASGGKVRQDIKPRDQITTYGDALGFLEKDPRFDSKRLGAWGTSLGGAHSLVVAANDPRVKRAVAIIPHIGIQFDAAEERFDMAAEIDADLKAEETGGPRVMIGVSGPPGSKAAMTTDGAVEWTKNVTKNAPNYRNQVTAASLLEMQGYSTADDAKKIKIPLRVMTAKDDTVTPAKSVHMALDGVSGVDFKDFPGTHFGLFGANLTETIDLTVDWFKGKL